MFQKGDHFENQLLSRGYSPCKLFTLEHVKIHSTNHLELFFAENPSKKHYTLEK